MLANASAASRYSTAAIGANQENAKIADCLAWPARAHPLEPPIKREPCYSINSMSRSTPTLFSEPSRHEAQVGSHLGKVLLQQVRSAGWNIFGAPGEAHSVPILFERRVRKNNRQG